MTAVRLVRTAVIAFLVAVLFLLPTAGVRAAGTGGVELSPYPGVKDGKQVTAFRATVPRRGSVDVRYSLRNTTDAPRTARLYAASATKQADGQWSIGDAGTSPYISGFSTRSVTLRPGEVQIKQFQVSGDVRDGQASALVVEVTAGSVTQRAATLVYLTRGPVLPVPVLLAIGALLVALCAGIAILVVRRQRRT